ncbi:MAG: hypothetical protein A2277_20820 [Desulfobacterales bacterium RIFOXYA12_FULL_46_15]|nr:MAG: hypothetical protein A2097_01085 [Desulfobacula sp. GWF2_41_7]OGR26342.1 MAG: hypothetical protein A2277_20820 [Desulfobacterales bacterium RIFOXYA12_FULL_46_15]
MIFERERSFFLDTILHSYSQILFSENKGFGAALLLSSFIHPYSGVNGLLGALCINFFAYILGYGRTRIRAGVFGFNGILFGMALSLYNRASEIQNILFVILFSILLLVITVWMRGFFQKKSLPFLSIPFVVMTWIIILLNRGTGTTEMLQLVVKPEGYPFKFLVITYLNNLGHIIFSPNIISGLIIAAALFLYSRVMFFISVLSFAAIVFFSYILPQYLPFVINDGFNPILTSIAIGGVFFAPGILSLIMAIIASLFTVVIDDILIRYLSLYNLSSLTLSFNIVTWLFIYAMQHNYMRAGLFRIYFPESPEANYKKFLDGQNKFGITDQNFILPFIGWWFVSQGVGGKHTHKGIYKWGLDFIVTDKSLCPYQDDGTRLEDHFCFNKPVISPGNGIVCAIESSIPDNPVTSTNLDNSWGNYVILKHNQALFSILCHLGQKKITTHPYSIIKTGDPIGNAGSSGLAPYPHLHIQFQTSEFVGAPTVAMHFSDYLVRKKDQDEYIPFGIPGEQQVVSNIPIDNGLKDMIGFELGKTTKYELITDSKTQQEYWTCDMESKGILFIESSLNRDRLLFLRNERSVSFIGYIGKKTSGLYLMSLAIDKIPFYTSERLVWHKSIPYSDVLFGFQSFFWEPILPFLKNNFIRSTHIFRSENNKLELSSKIYRNSRVLIAQRRMDFDKGLETLFFTSGPNKIHLNRI